jgi:hypothetical protein
MKKIIILIIMVMVIAVPALAKEYRSMCELHPEECAEGDLAMLFLCQNIFLYRSNNYANKLLYS